MTPALLGRKIGMTRVYDEKGTIVPVTVVQAVGNHVTHLLQKLDVDSRTAAAVLALRRGLVGPAAPGD